MFCDTTVRPLKASVGFTKQIEQTGKVSDMMRGGAAPVR